MNTKKELTELLEKELRRFEYGEGYLLFWHIDAEDIENYLPTGCLDSLEDTKYFLCELMDEKNAFNVEVIYYRKAMEYLMTNDASLMDSLSLAYELGYNLQDLNSETLASILATHNNREDFLNLPEEDFLPIYELINELNNFI